MEEIDNIILDSLKNLECDIPSDVENLKQFDADLVILAVSTCLEAILPGQHFPMRLPPSMSLKLKIASNIAEQIKDLGFRGDMGYQTILYCNEVEIRRVLMFLIERLPRENNKTLQIEQTGYVPKLVKRIEDSLKLALNQMWIPSSVLPKGIRECESGYVVQSFGNSVPINLVKLNVPDTRSNPSDELKEYWVKVLPEVTKQCSKQNLISSLMYNDEKYDLSREAFKKLLNKSKESMITADLNINLTNNLKLSSIEMENEEEDDEKQQNISEMQLLIKDLEDGKIKYIELQENNKKLELKLNQISSMKNEEQEVLKDTISKVKLKTKTMAVLNKEENLVKLKNLVENASDRLIDLSSQWHEVQTPLLDEYRSLQNTLTTEELKIQTEQKKLNDLKEAYNNILTDSKEKDVLEENLREKIKQLNKSNNRLAYTRRILEIIGNIKKQNVEIEKILKDTKVVQKDINNLSGQVDRSFTLSDELIFQDAKDDEMARKAYKLLAALRDECGAILKAVGDLGSAERESRNLEEQVETESKKEISLKLEKVYQDLEEIRKETDGILKK